MHPSHPSSSSLMLCFGLGWSAADGLPTSFLALVLFFGFFFFNLPLLHITEQRRGLIADTYTHTPPMPCTQNQHPIVLPSRRAPLPRGPCMGENI